MTQLSEKGTCKITESNEVEYNLDVNADKMLLYFLATAYKSTASDIVRNVLGGVWFRAWSRCVPEQLTEALGLFVKWDRDVERLSIYCKGELGGWGQVRCYPGNDASEGRHLPGHKGGCHQMCTSGDRLWEGEGALHGSEQFGYLR